MNSFSVYMKYIFRRNLENNVLSSLHKSSRNWARICKHLRSPEIDSKESIPPTYVAWRNRFLEIASWVENLSPAMGRGIDFRNKFWNWVANLHRLAGRCDNPMPTWFLTPIAGLKLPIMSSLNVYKFELCLVEGGGYSNPPPPPHTHS